MNSANIWSQGIQPEFNFWYRWLTTRGAEWPADYQFRTDPNSELQEAFARTLPQGPTPPKILDVGAGPMTFLGKKLRGQSLDITAVDALADLYDILPFPSGLPLIKTQKCFSEELSQMFRENTFDLTIANNTLDHSIDPVQAIREMIKITKPGGSIITQHAANEAKKHNYHAFHQWNFYISERCMFVGNTAINKCINC